MGGRRHAQLGSSVDRREFQTMLVEMLNENNVEFVHVEESDYDTRFLRCVELVKEMMGSRVKIYPSLTLSQRERGL